MKQDISTLIGRFFGGCANTFLFLYLWNYTGAPWSVVFTTVGVALCLSVAVAVGVRAASR